MSLVDFQTAVSNPGPKTRLAGSVLGRISVWFVYIVTFAILIGLFWDGYSYYSTPYSERPHHPDYREFRPAGSLGLTYGLVGSSMMVLMLVYSIRKRSRLLGRTITLRTLLNFHIYLGVVGPLFIVLHTSFKIQGLVAVSFWSMVAVALSGYFGRYLYLQIPRSVQGNELTLQQIEEQSESLSSRLKGRFSLDDDSLSRIEQLTEPRVSDGSAIGSIPALLKDDLLRPLHKSRLRRQLKRALRIPKRQIEEVVELTLARFLLRRRIVMLSRVQQLFHYWHVIHKPFAIIMYVIMLVHIGVAVWTGYAWFK